jgi:glycosyltransferase involved in cell wall biosynthesis
LNSHIITSLDPGGAEKVLTEYLHYTQTSAEVIVLKGSGYYSAEIESTPHRIHYLHLDKFRLWNLVKIILTLRKTPAVKLICWLPHAQIVGTLLHFLSRKPPLIFMHRQSVKDYTEFAISRQLIIRIVCICSNYANYSVFNSINSQESFRSLGANTENSSVLYNGVNKEKYSYNPGVRNQIRSALSVSRDERLILWVGRWHEEKGIDFAIDVCLRILHSERKLKFCFVGERGNYNSPALNLLYKNHHVLIIKPTKNISDLMNAADLLMITSRSESCPNVLFEALATSLPIVSTNVGDVDNFLPSSNIVEFGDLEDFSSRVISFAFKSKRPHLIQSESQSKIMTLNQSFDSLEEIIRRV